MTKYLAEAAAKIVSKEDGLKAAVLTAYAEDNYVIQISRYNKYSNVVEYEATIGRYSEAMLFVRGVQVGKRIEAEKDPMEIDDDDD